MPSRFLVFSNPVEGSDEKEFVDWYEATHMPDVLKVPGVVGAQRYTVAEMTIPDNEIAVIPPPPQRFLVIYEVEGSPSDVMADFLARLMDGRMVLSPLLDLGSVSMAFWEPSGEAQVSAAS